MKVLVTGASGHLGRYVVQRLSDEGHEILAASRSGAIFPPFSGRLAGNVQPIRLDLDDDQSVVAAKTAAWQELEGVVHLAAWHPPSTASTGPSDRQQLVSTNVFGTMRLLEAVRGTKVTQVVYASSFEVYGSVTAIPVTEDARLEPLTDYGATKLAGEDHLLAFGYEESIRVAILRFPAIYGPGEKTSRALPNFLASVARGEVPEIHGDGSDLRDQLHARDAARAISLALSGDAAGIFNVADGQPHSIAELASLALRAAGMDRQAVFLPRQKELRNCHLSIDKARRELGFQPEEELLLGMQEELAWIANGRPEPS